MKRLAGIFCGIVSAVSYGTNPVFAVPLLRDGYGVDSMLLFRFLLASLLLAPLQKIPLYAPPKTAYAHCGSKKTKCPSGVYPAQF